MASGSHESVGNRNWQSRVRGEERVFDQRGRLVPTYSKDSLMKASPQGVLSDRL